MKSLLVAGSLLALADPAAAQSVERVAPDLMRRIAPGLAGYTDEVLFGDVWKRPGLALRERSIVTVSALIATGKTEQLTGHLGRALDNGVKPVEISEVITHLAFYSGWPSAVSALPVADQVFRQHGIDDAALRPSQGERIPLPASDRTRAASVNEQVAPAAPKLARAYQRRPLRGSLAPARPFAPRPQPRHHRRAHGGRRRRAAHVPREARPGKRAHPRGGHRGDHAPRLLRGLAEGVLGTARCHKGDGGGR